MGVAELADDHLLQQSPLPPNKRSRHGDHPPIEPRRYALSSDPASVMDAVRELIVLQRPDLMDAFLSFLHLWQNGPARWPASQLTSAQQHLAAEGILSLDSESQRWSLLLTPLLPEYHPSSSAAGPGPMGAASGTESDPTYPSLGSPPLVGGPLLSSQQSGSAGPGGSRGMSQSQGQSPGLHPLGSGLHGLGPGLQGLGPSVNSATCGFAGPSSFGAGGGGASGETSCETWTSKFAALLPSVAVPPHYWSGTLARNEKRKTPVTLMGISGDVPQYIPSVNGVLSVSLRSPYEEMLKKEFVAFGLLQSAAGGDTSVFNEYISYFDSKNRAGVIRPPDLGDNTMLYLMPLTVPGLIPALQPFNLDINMETTSFLLLIVAKTAPE